MPAVRNILNRALIADELPLCIAHDMRVLRNPDARPIATVNFRLEIEHLPLRFHDLAKLITAIAIDVEAVLDVGKIRYQFRSGRVTVEPRQRGICGEVMAVGGSLKNALRCMLEYTAIAQLGLLQRLERDPLTGAVFDKPFYDQLALLVVHGNTALDHPFDISGAGGDAVLHREALMLRQRCANLHAHVEAIIGMRNLLPGDTLACDDFGRGIAGQTCAALADKNHRPGQVVATAIGHSLEIVYQRVEDT